MEHCCDTCAKPMALVKTEPMGDGTFVHETWACFCVATVDKPTEGNYILYPREVDQGE